MLVFSLSLKRLKPQFWFARFLGLHMDVIQERLEREFADLIMTAPSVASP